MFGALLVDILIIDRALMGFSLAVHIILAVIGMSLPVMISAAELLSMRGGNSGYKVLASRMTKALVLFFAVGTASGTVVAMELFLLWPKFMALAGQVAILPVYMEVFAFFTEAIFIAIYVHTFDSDWGKLRHWLASVIIIIGSAATAMFITLLNAFMNTPVGFNIQTYLQTGNLTDISPTAVFSSPSAGVEVPHVLATSYFAGIMLILAYLAYGFIKSDSDVLRRYYGSGMRIAFAIGIVATLAALVTGIVSITSLYSLQPEKYAALEADLVPMANAPEYIGGLFINGSYKYYIAIPGLQSLLATGSLSGSVPGLSSYPQSTWPPLFPLHVMFDVVVFGGFLEGLLMFLIVAMAFLRMKPLENKTVLWLLVAAGVFGLFVLEDGWIMEELGRQPWIIYNVMTVASAANYSTGVLPIMALLALFYITVIPFTIIVLNRVLRAEKLEEVLKA